MRRIILLIGFLIVSAASYAQDKLSTERIGEMLRASGNVVFSKKISDEILAFSSSPNADKRQVEKNMIYLRTLLNEELPARERLAFSDLVVRQFDREGTGQSVALPLDLVNRIRTDLKTR